MCVSYLSIKRSQSYKPEKTECTQITFWGLSGEKKKTRTRLVWIISELKKCKSVSLLWQWNLGGRESLQSKRTLIASYSSTGITASQKNVSAPAQKCRTGAPSQTRAMIDKIFRLNSDTAILFLFSLFHFRLFNRDKFFIVKSVGIKDTGFVHTIIVINVRAC